MLPFDPLLEVLSYLIFSCIYLYLIPYIFNIEKITMIAFLMSLSGTTRNSRPENIFAKCAEHMATYVLDEMTDLLQRLNSIYVTQK